MPTRKVILSMSMTFDGYVAANNNEMDWMKTSDEEWKNLFEDLDEADTYLLGRKMYPEYSQYWQSVLNNPASKPWELKFAQLADKTQHIFFTKGDFTPDWKNTRVAHDLQAEIAKLKKQPGKNIIAWGGARFAANLIEEGLADEIRIVLNPTLLGDGKALFENVHRRRELELIRSESMKPGLVVTEVKVMGESTMSLSSSLRLLSLRYFLKDTATTERITTRSTRMMTIPTRMASM